MRRLVAAVAVTSALLVAGCSSGKTATTTAGSTPAAAAPGAATSAGADPGAAAAADAALAGNTKAICTPARTTTTNAEKTFAQDVKLVATAKDGGGSAAVAQAEVQGENDVANYAYALKDMSDLVADPTVKQALADMSAAVTKLKDADKIDAEQQGKLAGMLAKACGNG